MILTPAPAPAAGPGPDRRGGRFGSSLSHRPGSLPGPAPNLAGTPAATQATGAYAPRLPVDAFPADAIPVDVDWVADRTGRPGGRRRPAPTDPTADATRPARAVMTGCTEPV